MSQRALLLQKVSLAAAMMLLGCLPAFGQSNKFTIDLNNGTSVTVTTSYGKRLGAGPAQAAHLINQAGPTTGLAFYGAHYNSFGKALLFNIVGTDPSLGAATTTVPTSIVPLKFVFPNTGNPTLDGTNVVTATENSPLFLTADYTTGATDIGVTQYGDAMQRGQFWNLPGFSLSYHVLLGTPTVMPTVTVNVPAGKGNAFTLRSGRLLGVLDPGFFDQVLAALLPAFTANSLPVFLTDNVFLGTNGQIGNCCVLGFHNSQSAPISTAQTWIYAAYTEAGTFRGDVILDVQPLSHEVSEWLNDPFVGAFPVGINLIAPAVLPGTGGQCIINFETGDPLEAPPIVFTKVTNATTYHLQDEVFLPWYLHTNPSFSVNGFYTFLNTFPSFSQLCGPG